VARGYKRVELHGTSRADMNGKRGVATGLRLMGGRQDPTTWRYTVELDGGRRSVRAQAEGRAARVAAAGRGRTRQSFMRDYEYLLVV